MGRNSKLIFPAEVLSQYRQKPILRGWWGLFEHSLNRVIRIYATRLRKNTLKSRNTGEISKQSFEIYEIPEIPKVPLFGTIRRFRGTIIVSEYFGL